jgi:Lrp/AsnC family transcriptional regulator, leucine-responsive regulatory protein
MVPALDDRDDHILELLQADAWLTYAELARRVHLSASAVQRRVERLIALGIITGAHAEVNLNDARAYMYVFLLVELADDAASTINRLARALGSLREVIEAHYVAGDTDVVLKIHVTDMAAYDQFVQRNFNRSPLIRRFKTLAVLRSLK